MEFHEVPDRADGHAVARFGPDITPDSQQVIAELKKSSLS
jgi:hypothetical protein